MGGRRAEVGGDRMAGWTGWVIRRWRMTQIPEEGSRGAGGASPAIGSRETSIGCDIFPTTRGSGCSDGAASALWRSCRFWRTLGAVLLEEDFQVAEGAGFDVEENVLRGAVEVDLVAAETDEEVVLAPPVLPSEAIVGVEAAAAFLAGVGAEAVSGGGEPAQRRDVGGID